MKQIVLVGLMATGKSTVGRLVAERTGRTLADSDVAIGTETGETVRELWETGGEVSYRALESEFVLTALLSAEPLVVTAPGGAVLDPEVRERLADHDVVWLRADPATLAQRVTRGDHRPLLGDDPLGVLTKMAQERSDLYQGVSMGTVDVDHATSTEVAERVLDLLSVARGGRGD